MARRDTTISKNGRHFIKDKKALIYKTGTYKDGNKTIKYYVPRSEAPLWCYTRQTDQNAVYISGARMYSVDETRLFVFNYRQDVKVYDIIAYRGAYFQVSRVDTADDYNGDLFVHVKDAPTGSTPKESEIMPPDWTPPV